VNEQQLRERIQEAVKSGRLPRDRPNRGRLEGNAPIPMDRVGALLGASCDGCGETITSGRANCQYEYAGGRRIAFHESCDRIWNDERVRL
jgi:hypothetical protein